MRHIILGLVTLLAAPHALAVNKCVGADGRIVYQDAPCPTAAKSSTVRVQDSRLNTPEEAAAINARTRLSNARAERQRLMDEAIVKGIPVPGMTREELGRTLGQPDRANLGAYGASTSHQLIFDRGDRTWYVYVRNDVVDSVQNTARLGR